MRHRLSRLARALCVAWALVAVPSLLATSVIAPDFQTMVDRSDLIFTGRMTSQHSEWREIDGHRSIVTLVRFQTLAVYKGKAGSTIDLQFLGGKVGDVSLDVAEIPRFAHGERVVLFVEKNGTNASPLVGFYHGKFKLQQESGGREIVLAHDGPVSDTMAIGRAAATRDASRRAMSHDEFAERIREATRKTR